MKTLTARNNNNRRMDYTKLSKQMQKTYLSLKSNNSIPFKIMSYCLLVFVLFCMTILLNNQYNRLNATQMAINTINTRTISANKESPSPTSEIESWRFVENNPKYPINSNPNQSDPIYVPLNKPWGHIYTPTRILCLIPTLWPTRKWKMDLIRDTYGPHCSKLMWVVDDASDAPKSYAGFDFLILQLSRHQNHTKHVRNIWEKVHRMWTAIYSTPSLLDNFEWFIKADDDTFVVTENLFGFLQYYDSSYPHYLGHALRARWQKDNVIFNSGTCYAISRQTIKNIGKYLQYLPTVHPPPSTEHCVDREGAGEDPQMGCCLGGIGVRPGNTLDHELRERFLIFRDTDHVIMYREDTWYWKYRAHGVAEGKHCCSPYVVSMHNYKDRHGEKEVIRLFKIMMEKYNQPKNWSEIILPPRPRLVIWDRNELDFEVDAYYNVMDPPKGQRIYKGPGKDWQCHKCDIGDGRDKWWTEWWDDAKETDDKSQHVNDVYSPIKSKH